MGSVTGVEVFCAGCDSLLDEPSNAGDRRRPCPTCGGMNRRIEMRIEEHVRTTSMLGLKHRRPGVKKPLLDLKTGESISADGTVAQVDQAIDRTVEPARYRKRVVKADGTVVRDVDHPLSEHVGRGSAKPKKP